jgi:replicative DNA helicase
MRIERSILSGLVFNEAFTRKVLPFLKPEYFSDRPEKIAFEVISAYIDKYNTLPSKDALMIDLGNRDNLPEELFETSRSVLNEIKEPAAVTEDNWLIDQCEKFCQSQAITNALRASIAILDDKTGQTSTGAIPQLLSDALGISFDSNVGHDFIADFEKRYDFYHQTVKRIPFLGLEMIDKITKGGLPQKTLNLILGGVNVGKSLVMCHGAAHNLALGNNVLYITLELAEEMVAQRIDANLLNVPMSQIELMPKDMYVQKITKLREKTAGRLIIKEYPTAGAGSANFRHLLNELRIKKNFVPDIIYIDYLNICVSSRMKMSPSINSYTYMKAVAEELRGLAVEFKVPIVSATQMTRSGFSNSDAEMTDISESFGVAATVDFMIAVISTEEMQEKNMYIVKQLKSRYGDPSMNRKFVIGVDKSYMRLYDADDNENDSASQEVVNKATGEITTKAKSMKDFNKKFFSEFK